jgi:transposase
VFSEDLGAICRWLADCRITTVAMESTGVYWVPLFKMLEAHGIEVYLVNAKAVKNFVEKKTDRVDAESLMLLHSYGLLKRSFQVNNSARQLRNLSRHRDKLIQTAAKEIQHVQKCMELMNIKLVNVLSDVMGKSGQAIIRAILAGERNTKALASLADPRCKTPQEIIEKSLEGTWDEDLLFAMKQSYDLYLYIQGQIQSCELRMGEMMEVYANEIGSKELSVIRSKKPRNSKSSLAIDVEQYGIRIFGVNLMRVPGINESTVLRLIAELGHDFTDSFDSCHHFCKWENLTPNNKISGGKTISSKLSKRKNPVGQVFRQAANSQQAAKSAIGDIFRKKRARKGAMQAIVATANRLSKIVFTMVRDQTEYDESLLYINEEEVLRKRLAIMQRNIEHLKAQLETPKIPPYEIPDYKANGS